MRNWDELAGDESIKKVATALNAVGIGVFITKNVDEAKKKVLEIIPEGAEIMTMASETLAVMGVDKELNESGRFNSIKARLMKMDRATQGREMQKLGASPEWAIGSVQAVTEDGSVFIASATGSQLGAYAYAASHVIWVVGTQKIVKNWDEGVKRVYEYALPHEDEKRKKLGQEGSAVRKLLVVSGEHVPQRITMVLVNEKVGV